jgi:glutamine synthetase
MCDILNPNDNTPYNRDPRMMAKKAEMYLKSSGVGDTAYFGPEAEFFVFDDVKWNTDPNNTGYSFDDPPNCRSTRASAYEGGNMGHRPGPKGGYFPVPPIDSLQDMRSEMLTLMGELGLQPEKHHHEVAPAQHELGMKFNTLVQMADNMQLYKYIVHNVAHSYGKTATFMPKPYFKDNGSGMHVHQSIWKDGKPLFAGDKYADLSQTCLWYIGGIIKHAKAINAFSNSTTNSYKRLVPGYEAPVLLAYSAATARPRSVFRAPHRPEGQAHRGPLPRSGVEPVPHLHRAADGRPRRHREEDRSGSMPMDKDLYALPPEELKRSRPSAARCAKRWRTSTATATSSRPAASWTTTSSTPTSTSRWKT